MWVIILWFDLIFKEQATKYEIMPVRKKCLDLVGWVMSEGPPLECYMGLHLACTTESENNNLIAFHYSSNKKYRRE